MAPVSYTHLQALASLNTSAAGLGTSEAKRRLAEFGPNHLEEIERENLLLRFAQEFTHFFAIILWIGATLAFVAEYFDPAQGMARLGVATVSYTHLDVYKRQSVYRVARGDPRHEPVPRQR